MQQQTPAHEIGKGAFVAEALWEFFGVCGVGLDAQGGGEDELTDCGGEAGEECVEGLFF